MPEPSDGDILNRLRAMDAEQENANALLPQNEPSFRGLNPDISRVAARPSRETRLQSFADLNRRDVPLDIKTGPPAMQMMRSSFLKDPEQAIKYWQDKYGKENVRLASNGTPIVRVLNEDTGKPEDILVNPETMSAKDLTKIAGQIPEIAVAILADKGIGMIPKLADAAGLLKVGRQAGAQAIGAEAGGLLKDVAMRTADQLPIGEETLTSRIKSIPMDIGANLAMAGGAKLLGKAISPFGGELPPVQTDLKEAREYWRNRGIKIPYSAGEQTGSGFLQRSEEEMKRLPGGTFGLNDIREEQKAAFQKIQNILSGLPEDATAADKAAALSKEGIGAEAIGALRASNEMADVGVAAAKDAAAKEFSKGILNDMASATTPTRQLYATKVGEAVRRKVQDTLSAFQDQSKTLYDQAYALPGGKDRILTAPGLAAKAEKAFKALPGEDKITSTPMAIVGPTGAPIMLTKTGREVWKEFVPSNVIDKLQRLSKIGSQEFSLQDLVAMRNEVTNDIKLGEAVPGVQTHHLGKIRDMLTEAIHDATGAIPDQKLKTAWEAANNYYRDNVQKFHTHGISTILKEAAVPGSVGNAEIVQRLTGESPRATDTFLDMKKFLGPTSPEFTMLKRSIADSLYENAMETGKNTLNAKAFVGAMENLRTNQREVFDEVFGAKGNDIILKAKQLGLTAGDKLDVSDMEKILSDPHAPVRLRDLVHAQRERDELYKNSILKAVGSNTLPVEGIKASEFISRFANSSSPNEVRQAMKMIDAHSPELAQQIKFRTIEDLLNESSRTSLPQDRVAFRLDPSRVISSHKLETLMLNGDRQKVLAEIIGLDGIEDLKQLAKATRPIEAKQAAFASAGGISGGMQVNRFWQGGVLGFIDKALRNTVGAAILSFPATRAYVGNTAMTPARTAQLVTMAITSRPVVQELIKDYGEKGAMQAAETIKLGLRNYVASEGAKQQQLDQTVPAETGAILNMLRKKAEPARTP